MWRAYGAEWFADAIVNTAGVATGLAACLVLIGLMIHRAVSMAAPQARSAVPLALGLYGAGLMAMLTCSALYNLSIDHPQRDLFRRLDHAAIFLMIAGTYSPFGLLAIRGPKGVKLLFYVWTVAGIGAALKILAPHQFEQLSLVVYLLLGWAIVIVRHDLRSDIPRPGMALMAVGCALYSIGVVFYLWSGLHYQVAIWHAFVLAAAACHYASIVGYVSGPTALRTLALTP